MKTPAIFIGADHAGFELKEKLKDKLREQKITVTDLSPKFMKDDDYPLQAKKVTLAVSKDKQARGILVCGNGVGMVITANRLKGVRAFAAHSVTETKLAREHNDANVIALSGWSTDLKSALQLTKLFLSTPASKATRHLRRIKQLD